MTRNFAICCACLVVILAVGCDTKSLNIVAADPGAQDVPADIPVADAGPDVPVVDDVLHDAVVPVSYVPPASFRFRSAGREGDDFVVQIVAHDFSPVFGIALRVEWDAASLSLVSASTAPIFGAEAGGEAVYKVAAVRPGSLAVGLAHLYYLASTPIEGDVVVATMLMKSLDNRPADLGFFAPRCLLIDSGRTPIEAVWLTSTLNP